MALASADMHSAAVRQAVYIYTPAEQTTAALTTRIICVTTKVSKLTVYIGEVLTVAR
jgi:hypothetical protein